MTLVPLNRNHLAAVGQLRFLQALGLALFTLPLPGAPNSPRCSQAW